MVMSSCDMYRNLTFYKCAHARHSGMFICSIGWALVFVGWCPDFYIFTSRIIFINGVTFSLQHFRASLHVSHELCCHYVK